MKKTTEKQKQFAKEYTVDLNATKAAERAGYKKKSARKLASRTIQKPEVRELIQAEMDERAKRTEITADRVVKEIACMALFDPLDFIAIRSASDIANLTEDARRAITGWKYDSNGNFILEFDKPGALSNLGRHLKLFTDKIEHSVSDELAERMARARANAIREGSEA